MRDATSATATTTTHEGHPLMTRKRDRIVVHNGSLMMWLAFPPLLFAVAAYLGAGGRWNPITMDCLALGGVALLIGLMVWATVARAHANGPSPDAVEAEQDQLTPLERRLLEREAAV